MKMNNQAITARVLFNRSSSKIGFLTVSILEPFGRTQIVYKKNEIDNFEEIAKLSSGAAIKVIGEIVQTPDREQESEIRSQTITIIQNVTTDYPLQKKEHSFEFLRENAHLRARSDYFSKVFLVRSKMKHWISAFFEEENFVFLDSPVITGNDCEGAGESFSVYSQTKKNFFNKSNVNLTVSGQLACETFAQAYGKAYTFSPIFRAEVSNTVKHAAEFWMLEPEIINTNLEEICKFTFHFIKTMFAKLIELLPKEVDFFTNKNKINIRERFQTFKNGIVKIIDYKDALKILKDNTNKTDTPSLEFGSDFSSEQEKFLTKHFESPIFVINYPKKIKSFYMKDNNDGSVQAFDFLVPEIGELAGGSVREDNPKTLSLNILEKSISIDNLQWYIDLRNEGYVKSAGFGLGFERMLMYFLGISNIRDVLPFPRAHKMLKF